MTSGGDVCHVGMSKLISNWSLRDTAFIGRSFGDYATSLVRAGSKKIIFLYLKTYSFIYCSIIEHFI